MKKELKWAIAFFVAVVAAVGFAACSSSDKDDDEGEGGSSNNLVGNNLVGTWEVVDAYPSFLEGMEVTFLSNGKVNLEGNIYGSGWDRETGRYKVRGHELYIELEDDEFEGEFYIKGKRLYYVYTYIDYYGSDEDGYMELRRLK